MNSGYTLTEISAMTAKSSDLGHSLQKLMQELLECIMETHETKDHIAAPEKPTSEELPETD
jgi:hypothetical protein